MKILNLKPWLCALSATLYFAGVSMAFSQNNPYAALNWQHGPSTGAIGDKATIQVPTGFVFLDAVNTAKFNEINQNLPSGQQYLVAPEDLSWFAYFQFQPVGYIKDDNDIDASALLNAVQDGTRQGNEERQRRGWDTLTVTGWQFLPHYDDKRKLLEWAFAGKNDRTQRAIVNYNTRILARTGVMEVEMVTAPENLPVAVQSLKSNLHAFDFVPGEKYSEFRAGDHVAEFGLAALIAGGAAAVATKKGVWAVIGAFLASMWKVAAAVVIGLLAGIKKLFSRKR